MTTKFLKTLLSETCFKPVSVTRGRKFKGNCFVVETWMVSNGGFSGSGVYPRIYYQKNKAWDPAASAFVYFNGHEGQRGLDEWKISEDAMLTAFKQYVAHWLYFCTHRCGSDMEWRANYLRSVFHCHAETAQDLAQESTKIEAEQNLGKFFN